MPPASKKAAARLPTEVPWLHIPSEKQWVLELEKQSPPPPVQAAEGLVLSPNIPMMGTPKLELGRANRGSQSHLKTLHGGRTAHQPQPAQCHILELPQAGIQRHGEVDSPGLSCLMSQHHRAGVAQRMLGPGGRQQRGSAEGSCPLAAP